LHTCIKIRHFAPYYNTLFLESNICLEYPLQVRARCKSEWAQFQVRLTNSDKAYLEGLKRNGKSWYTDPSSCCTCFMYTFNGSICFVLYCFLLSGACYFLIHLFWGINFYRCNSINFMLLNNFLSAVRLKFVVCTYIIVYLKWSLIWT